MHAIVQRRRTREFRGFIPPPSSSVAAATTVMGSGNGVRIIRNEISKWCSLITTRTNQLKQDSVNSVAKFHNHLFTSILNLPPPPLSFLASFPSPLKKNANLDHQVNGDGGMKYPIWMCVVALVLFVGVRAFAERVLSERNHRPGSVADLVRRGQLRSDRRGMIILSKLDWTCYKLHDSLCLQIKFASIGMCNLFGFKARHYTRTSLPTLSGDRFFWFRDEEFARQTVAGLNPLSISLVELFVVKIEGKSGWLSSNLTPKLEMFLGFINTEVVLLWLKFVCGNNED
ncbi:hypothetical protein Ahy_B05g078349 [Arachis hypogaea]|uniref:Lipoxygenase domain-containing protein n=1 Tax=Arachis hypogaea TaxID=3818 RepID=A0A444Z6V4_ARAHY|nr:hypothetical protein Ahy_B05g078349 [Arachis hypogaea]